jgi:hypothetical protein
MPAAAADWTVSENYSPDWWKRANYVASRLIREGERVCDLGCGPRDYSPFMPLGCTYKRADIKAWDETVEVCDLNKGIFPSALKTSDTALMIGVLEYITDLPALFKALSYQVDNIALTYCSSEMHPGRNRIWVNNLKGAEVVQIIESAGFRPRVVIEDRIWKMVLIRAERRSVFTRLKRFNPLVQIKDVKR